MDYYVAPWNSTKKECKQKIMLDSNKSLYRFCRNYGKNEALFYTDTSTFHRCMYIYIGSFLEKAILSYAEICVKCTKSSIKEAFKNCPNISKWFKDALKNKSTSTIIQLQLNSDCRHYCIQTDYYTFVFGGKKAAYMSLCQKAEIIRNELKLIDKSALRIKTTLWEKIRNAFLKNIKYVVRGGIIIAAACVGANYFDLPDFDFDIETPDVDFGDNLSFESYDMDTDVNFDVTDENSVIGLPDNQISLDENLNQEQPLTATSNDSDENKHRSMFSPAFCGSKTPPNSKSDGYIYDSSIDYGSHKVYRKNGKFWIFDNNIWIDITKQINRR